MPIVERDPWRMQYFEGVSCPEKVLIPTEDGDAYRWYPAQRWVYNKLLIAESQGLSCGPHGLEPDLFPVFSKPIYNMRGMGAGSQVFASAAAYHAGQQPGHMWSELLEGEHVSTDVAVLRGVPVWCGHVTGLALGDGVFDYWTVLAAHKPELEAYLYAWIERHLAGYSGMLNFETIGGRIIEAHLRFADQWPDLYGPGWVESLVALYERGEWTFREEDSPGRDGYSVVLFGAHGPGYVPPPAEVVSQIAAQPDVSSVQITFHDDKPAEQHSMPPGGFRLAIVNCWDLEAGQRYREQLALAFWTAQRLGARRRRRPRPAGGHDPVHPA